MTLSFHPHTSRSTATVMASAITIALAFVAFAAVHLVGSSGTSTGTARSTAGSSTYVETSADTFERRIAATPAAYTVSAADHFERRGAATPAASTVSAADHFERRVASPSVSAEPLSSRSGRSPTRN